MIKIAVFTEGQSELIFLRRLVFCMIDNAKLSFKCLCLRGYGKHSVYYDYESREPEVHFQIVNVGCDTKVISAIRERERSLLNNGFETIIGLRDMFSEEYLNRSPNKIDEELIQKFIESHNKIIEKMSDPDRIELIFSIMELEAWFLAMYKIFEKMNPILTVEYIKKQLGYNLKEIDPQKTFYQPTINMGNIFALCGRRYKKSAHEIESLMSNIELDDIESGFENDRCESLKAFYTKIAAHK